MWVSCHNDPFLTQTNIPRLCQQKAIFWTSCFTLIIQNYHLRLDLVSELCPYALSPVIMMTVVISFRLHCVFPSLTLQLVTPQSWSIQVPGWLLIAISYPFLLPHTISMLWLSDFLREVLKFFYFKRLVSNARCCCCNIWLFPSVLFSTVQSLNTEFPLDVFYSTKATIA